MVYDNGFMNGISDTKFAPNATLTREQFITVLYNIEGSPKTKYKRYFKDVPENVYYSEAVTWAYQNKITNGVSDTNFGTGNVITREQLATMLYNYAKLKGLKTKIDKDILKNYPDKKKISSWAEDGVKWAVTNKIMSGKKHSNGKVYLDLSEKASRAECAQMVKNLYENVIDK